MRRLLYKSYPINPWSGFIRNAVQYHNTLFILKTLNSVAPTGPTCNCPDWIDTVVYLAV